MLRPCLSLAVVLLVTLVGAPVTRAEEPTTPETLLQSGDPAKRIQGLEAMAKLGKDPAREKAALQALKDDDWGVAVAAAKALGAVAVGSDAARDALAKVAVEGEIAWLREAALVAAKAVDAPGAASRCVYAATVAKENVVRARAIDAVGRLASGEVFKKLRAWSKENDLAVEAAAVRAIGAIAHDAAIRDDALELLDDVLARRADRKHFLAYAAAIDAVAVMDLPKARELLVREVLLQPDDDDFIPTRAARALAKADPKQLAETLMAAWPKAKEPAEARRMARLVARTKARDAMDPLTALLSHKDEHVRVEALQALTTFGAVASVPAIAALLTDKSAYVREEALGALARLENPAAYLERASAAHADADADVRVRFVVELFDRGGPPAIPTLVTFFEDKDWRVSSAAICAAGALGIDTDLPKFEPFLRHRDWQVRGAAFEAIGRLRAVKAIPLLAEGLLDKDPVVRGVCHANLQILSRQKYSADVKMWRSWWAKNGDAINIVKRSRRTAEQIAKDAEPPAYAHEVGYRKRGVEILQKARILVVTGAWDHVERVLDHLRIPNTSLRAQELKAAGLNPNQIVLVNCEGNVDSDSAERLRWFVNVGGYLMSTDWAVTKAVNVCFPGYIRQFSGSSTGNDVVVVEDAKPGHPFTVGIFDDVPALQWWLEIQAFPLMIARPEQVEVLVDSRAMKQRYGSSPMAVTFRWGLGKVQHSVSHFYLQEEALAKATKPRERMIFAADNLGLSLDEIRRLSGEGAFNGQMNEAAMKQIAPDYSMFRLIVNVVAEKSKWVEDL